jgi:hypothetical protein
MKRSGNSLIVKPAAVTATLERRKPSLKFPPNFPIAVAFNTMKIIALTLIALSTLATSGFAGQFQDTLNDIDYQLQEINQRAEDQQFTDFIEHASRPEILVFLRNLAPTTPWARELLAQYGDASDRPESAWTQKVAALKAEWNQKHPDKPWR